MINPDDDYHWQQEVAVKSVGLGYLGEFALAIGQAISEFVPKIYGLRAGLLYYEQPPAGHQIASIEPDQEDILASAMTNYIAARQATFPVKTDATLKMFGQRPVWEQASELLSSAFGRGALLARIPILDPLAKRLLQAERLSVIDGDLDLACWFTGRSVSSPLVKTEFDERAFSNVELCCYDAIYDLAGLAIIHPSAQWARHLRDHFTQLTGQVIEAERWLLYNLVQQWDRDRRVPGRPGSCNAAMRVRCRIFLLKPTSLIWLPDLRVPSARWISTECLKRKRLAFPG